MNRYLSLKGMLHGQIPSIKIEDLYITLKAVAGDAGSSSLASARNSRDELETPGTKTHTMMLDTSFYAKQQATASKINVEDVIAGDAKLAILGEPGSGKTTLVRFLISQLIADPETWDRRLSFTSAPVPILVTLRSVDPTRLPFRRQLAEVCVPDAIRDDVPSDLISDLVTRGSCVLIFDGLDEVTNLNDRRKVSRWIEQLAASDSAGNRYIVTSRVAGYREAPLESGFSRFTLCEFDLDDIQSFVMRWYESVSSSVMSEDAPVRNRQVAHFTDRLLDVMREKPGIQQLAHNPLLLTIVLLVYSNRARLPEERAKLYQECIDVLLEHLQQAKLEESYRGAFHELQALRLDQRRDLLKTVALWLHENERTEAGDEELIDKALSTLLPAMGCQLSVAKPFLKETEERSGLIVQRAGGLGFSHLAFQEFLAALALAESEDPVQAIDFLAGMRFHSWWREVLQLYAALVPDGSRLIGRLLTEADSEYAHSLLLAGECVADARTVRNLQLRAQVIQRLTNLYLNSSINFHHRQARDILVRIGGEEVASAFRTILDDPAEDILKVVDAVEVISRIAHSAQTREVLFDLVSRVDLPQKVRIASIRGLRTSGQFDSRTERTLLDIVKGDESVAIRQESLTTLGYFGADPRLAALIWEQILTHRDYENRLDGVYVAALKAFAPHLESQAVLDLLEKQLRVPHAAEYKVEMCRAFAAISLDESRRVDHLITLLERGADWGSRGGAALMLGLSRVRREEVAHALSSRLLVDQELGVGMRIADALAHLGWRDSKVVADLRAALAGSGNPGLLQFATHWKVMEAYAALTRDQSFIENEMASLFSPKRNADVADRIEAIGVLQRIRYRSEAFTSSLIRSLDSMPGELLSSVLAYLVGVSRIPGAEIDTFRTWLRRILSQQGVDHVLRDRAFEAMFQLYGLPEAERGGQL